MEIATLSNLMCLASEVSGIDFSAEDAKLSEEAFTAMVKDIFANISLLQKWNRNGTLFSTISASFIRSLGLKFGEIY